MPLCFDLRQTTRFLPFFLSQIIAKISSSLNMQPTITPICPREHCAVLPTAPREQRPPGTATMESVAFVKQAPSACKWTGGGRSRKKPHLQALQPTHCLKLEIMTPIPVCTHTHTHPIPPPTCPAKVLISTLLTKCKHSKICTHQLAEKAVGAVGVVRPGCHA